MIVRDLFPSYYRAYLRHRAISGRVPWNTLAEQIGMTSKDISRILETLTTSKEEMIQKEYDYVKGRYNIEDGSPSFVWESEPITDLGEIHAFMGIETPTNEACAQ